jgi:hypothetical protein
MVNILDLLGITIPEHLIIGIVLIIVGILIVSFLPETARKYGGAMVIIGLILAVGFELIANWWKNDVFKAVMIGVGAFIIIIAILFGDKTIDAYKKIRRR